MMIEGKRYQAKAPDGCGIQGTDERVPGYCGVKYFKKGEDGVIQPEFSESGTVLQWDGAETQTDDNGDTLYLCECGNVWPESKLAFVEEQEDEVSDSQKINCCQHEWHNGLNDPESLYEYCGKCGLYQRRLPDGKK